MSLRRKRVNSVNVDFTSSGITTVQRFGSFVPQFFNENLEPILAVNHYMRLKALRLARKSLQITTEHLSEFLEWFLDSGLELSDIDEDSFDNYVEALCFYRKTNGEPLSWNTVNSRVAGAYRFLVWASEKGHCPNLQVSEAKLVSAGAKYRYRSRSHPSAPMKEPVKFLLIEDAFKIIDALGIVSGRDNQEVKRRNVLMGAFMLQTGVRISEACTFPLYDLPEVNPRLRLTPARLANGKGFKARVILIPNDLLLKLWEYVDIDRERISERVSGINGHFVSPTLFVSEKGTELSPNWLQKLFRKAGNYSGIKANPHILRHTFGTYHYLLNRDLSGLAKLMGQESIVTTEKYYVGLAKTLSYAGTYSGLNDEIDRIIEGFLNE